MIKNFRFKKADLGYFNDEHADAALVGFDKDCRILGLTLGRFSLIDLIHSILQRTGKADVICTTWSAGIKDIHNVKWMKDSALINDFKIITDRSYKSRKKTYAMSLEELFGIENIRTGDIHAKFTLISNEKFKVCIRTSMNLNANKTCENFEIDESQEIYDFYKKFVDQHFDKLKPGFTEQKSEVRQPTFEFFKQNKNNASWKDKKPPLASKLKLN